MLNNILSWWKDKFAFPIAIIYTISIVALSLINSSSIPISRFKVSDKLMHTVAYLLLMLVWLMVLKKKREKGFYTEVFFALFLFGIILELFQMYFTTYRTFDWWDIVANSIGLVIGTITFKLLINRHLKFLD